MSTFSTNTVATTKHKHAILPLYRGPQWVVTDIDGTFLDQHHDLSQPNVDAYLALREAEVPVIPATGRSYHALKTVLSAKRPSLEFKYFPGLYCNGSVCYGSDPSEVLYHAKLSVHMMRTVSKACYEWFDLEAARGFKDTNMTLFLQHLGGALLDFRTDFYEKFEREWFEEPSECLSKRFDDEVFKLDLEFNQLTIFVSEERTKDLLSYLRSNDATKELIEGGEMRCFNSTVMEINCLAGDNDKATGIERLIKRFNYNRSTLMTLGDGNNDLGMLQLAPYSVAMGQAKKNVKQSAKFVTSTTNEHGWAEAITMMILLPNDKI